MFTFMNIKKNILFYQIYAKTIFKKVSMHCYKDMQMLRHDSFQMCYSCDTSGKICSSRGKNVSLNFCAH